MAQQNPESHVPKFGDWDKDNIPYTAYFDNARQGKLGKKMNPNDPEQNPEAFIGDYRKIEDHKAHFISTTKTSADGSPYSNHGRSSGSHRSSTPEYSSGRGNHDLSLVENNSHIRSSNVKRRSAMAEELSPTPNGVNSSNQRITSVPKFGAWDEADPKSGEGYTVIFNKLKRNKQYESNSCHKTINPSTNNISEGLINHQSFSFRSKICGCIFPSPSD